MADEFLYKETVNPVDNVGPMVDKNMYWIADQNGSAYNGQILFDTSILANSGQWLAYSEAYIEVPFIITMSTSASLDAAAAPAASSFVAGLKNGYHHLIDSIQVDYNNTNVVQLQPFTNFFVNYKIITAFSADDLKKWGPSIGFSLDSAGSYRFSAAASVDGDGYTNNRVYPLTAPSYAGANTAALAITLDTYNAGYAQRLKQTGFPATVSTQGQVAATGSTGFGGVSILSAANCANIGKNYCQDNGPTQAAGKVIQWTIIATIRLKDLSDWFDKLPLVKGAFMRITLNYNSSTSVVTGAAGPLLVTATAANGAIVMNSGRTNPVMVSSAAPNNPNVTIGAVVGNLTFRSGVVNVSNRLTAPPIQQCRLYVPAYSMNSIYEKELISMKPFRTIKYLDIYNYNIIGTTAGSPFNNILTNGIVNPKYLVVIPYANSSTAASVFATYTGPVYTSVFDSAPGTTTPLASITQFQVQVAGQNMLQQNFLYDFENFFNEVSSINAINGGLSTGITNGLIGQYEWDTSYRYYVCDLSRRLPAEDKVPKSVVVQGINNTQITMDYYCFIAFEREVTIDMQTGAIKP